MNAFLGLENNETDCMLGGIHTENVTQVHFVPGHHNKLLSASVDGLICQFDTGGDINDDDLLLSVFNIGTSTGKDGVFGEANQRCGA